jgi:hypothetical protein
MGIPHPGHQPGSPPRSPNLQSMGLTSPQQERRESGSSDRPSPPSNSDSLKPAGWLKRKEGNGPLSPPNRSLGQLITGSATSLGSPVKQESSDSPDRRKPVAKIQEVPRWPDECRSFDRSDADHQFITISALVSGAHIEANMPLSFLCLRTCSCPLPKCTKLPLALPRYQLHLHTNRMLPKT